MKAKLIYSIFVLFALIAATPSVFAEEKIVGVVDCTDTDKTCYTPEVLTVNVGDTVVFSNTDTNEPHTFSSGVPSDDDAGELFGKKLLKSGESESWTPDMVGEYPYFCFIHPWKEGMIIVQEAGAEIDDPVEPPKEPVNEPADMKDDPVEPPKDGGGCLIATAAYGTEMAPQIQSLREIRDGIVLSTESGKSFMSGFNQIYYSFSPQIADWERENPAFKETVKVFITPMLSTLSILNYANIDSEQEMITFGAGIILLNIGMYVGIPVLGVMGLRQFRK